jgi:hypothetical protein
MVVKTVKVSKRDLKTILGDELELDIKAFGKVLTARGLWDRDHWEYIVVTFEKGNKKYVFDF